MKFLFIFILSFSTVSWAKTKSNLQFEIFAGSSLINTELKGYGDYDNSWIAGLGIRYIPPDDWMYGLSAYTMGYREVNQSLTTTLPIVGTITSSNSFKYRLSSISLDLGYNFIDFYSYIGISYNLFDYESSSSSTPYRGKPGTGFTLGIGSEIIDEISIEGVIRSADVTLESGAQYETSQVTSFIELDVKLIYVF